MTPVRPAWVYAGAAALCMVSASSLFRRFRNRNSEKAERRRRERLNRIGRIAQCEILDIVDAEPPTVAVSRRKSVSPASSASPLGWRALVTYRYTISGVSYETAQDVAASSDTERPPVPGQMATIRYDPANPSNSILVAWGAPEPSHGEPKTAAPETGK